jgi:pyridoxamine 5'-phosphate oxidase
MNQDESARLRREYEDVGLDAVDMADTPMAQFELWYAGAVASGIHEPNAFVLSTSTSEGLPSGRAVLLKETTNKSFYFYTNLESRKSQEIRANPNVAATFLWLPLHRQIRFEGVATPVADDLADAYFATRPRGAQVAAHSSRQSQPAATREDMERVFAERDASFSDAVPRPEWWGGWELTPHTAEFWQGRVNRFHDRLRYRRDGETWIIERLQP